MQGAKLCVGFFLTVMVTSGLSQQAATSANFGSKASAWEILKAGISSSSYEKRAKASEVMGLLKGNAEAQRLATAALKDERPEVRAAAAEALGDMDAKSAVPELERMFEDKDVSVILSSAKSLLKLGDNKGYNVYYAILTGETKTGKGLLDEQKKMLKDPQKMAQFGFETGIGFIPFAGVGWGAFKMLRKDDTSPVLAAAAITLAPDPDPRSGEALMTAAQLNKSWLVRAAALNALAKRGDPSLIKAAENQLQDEKEEVQYSAAAAVIRLSDIAEQRSSAHPPHHKRKK